MAVRKNIPKELESLVSWSLDLLGKAIEIEFGEKTFSRVIKLRNEMKKLRKSDADKLYSRLLLEKNKLSQLSTEELAQISISYSFGLELINRCENAYRSHQLSKKNLKIGKKKPYAIIMVLTAHPTEARSPQLLQLFSTIQEMLISHLDDENIDYEDELYHLILIGLKTSIARRKKPTVLDEAENIYSYILEDKILDSLIRFSKKGVNLSFRAWVGGDKDGHPGVNEKTMIQSLGLSRSRLVDFVDHKLAEVENLSKLVKKSDFLQVNSILKDVRKSLKNLRIISKGDGERIVEFKKCFRKLEKSYILFFQINSPRVEEIKSLLWVFPALVVPLEVREDSEVVQEALKSKKPLAIEKMLKILKEISIGYKAKWYVRGFILSMVESHTDVINGHKLIQKVFNRYEIPVVPLFENEKALTNAEQILKELFKIKKTVPAHHISKWGGRYEVMVGYSDSSKENGVFPSRYMISDALKVIEKTLKSFRLTPVFFHGSGGSVERGGGPIKEQTRWWPKSAINIYKATIQGEMVARNFGNSEIFSSQITKIVEQLNLAKEEVHTQKKNKTIYLFSEYVRKFYSETIQNDDFFEVIDSATPYSFLSHLKIGSRPSKRETGGDSRKLRAIPWILCWTQTRVLFPTWWGTGSAWKQLSKQEQKIFINEYKTNPLISSFMIALGFTLAKVELGVWRVYLKESKLSEKRQVEVYEKFKKEYRAATSFFREVTGKKELLWFRPWLQESIDYRSSMIHPLNLIQLESLKRGDIDLLRDTVTGISCGMLTTG